MENTPISQQIEEMIKGRAASGPGMIKQYGSSLAAAAGQDQKSIDDLRGIYSDPSKFETSTMGALGLGLMKGTKSGSFNESMYNGLAAATAAKDYNREQNLSREEKLAKLSSLQAQLTRQQANDTLGVYDKQTGYMTSAQADQNTLADIELAKAPKGPRPLNPGEFGPSAPGSDHFSKSMTIYNDYLTNPQKYAGPQGRALVEDALNVIKNERTNARYENVAGMRTQNKPTVSGPEERRISGRIKTLDEAAEGARSLKSDVALLRAARDKVGYEGRLGADWWASLTGWATDSGAAGQDVRSKAVSMKLTLSEKLKGAISNAEQVMLDSASPGLAMADAAAGPVLDGYEAAADRAIERSKFLKAWKLKNGDDYGADEAWDVFINDNPIVVADEATGQLKVNKGNVAGWQSYVTDVNAEDGPPAPAASQFDSMDPATVLGEDADGNVITVDDVLTTARENNMTPEQVIERLRSGN